MLSAMAGQAGEMDVSEVCEAKGATVHGVLVGHLSPVKESHGKAGVKYFKGKLSDGKKTLRIVSFEPKLLGDLERITNSGERVAVVNCSVQKSKRPGSEELAAAEVFVCLLPRGLGWRMRATVENVRK